MQLPQVRLVQGYPLSALKPLQMLHLAAWSRLVLKVVQQLR
jgi:hypothetical protein